MGVLLISPASPRIPVVSEIPGPSSCDLFLEGLAELSESKQYGGLGLPGPVRYHQVVHLAKVEEWCRVTDPKSWVRVEQASSGNPLAGLPWLLRHIPKSTRRQAPQSGSAALPLPMLKFCHDPPGSPKIVCVVRLLPRHRLSLSHTWLSCPSDGYFPPYIHLWERDLGASWSVDQKTRIINLSHEINMVCAAQL